ncbi:MAG: hypothetical protein IK065_07300 [Neisseriaceae bacterium]|nr:hypothetical protein [Neisseriaceae bacterium]
MGFPAHQNAVGVNPLYFNNFLFHYIGRLVGCVVPTYGVSFSKIRFCKDFLLHVISSF